MNTRLMQRDIEMVKWISQTYLSTSLITEFFFNRKEKLSRRRLKKLVDAGYLSWFLMPTQSSGRWEHVFYLNKKSHKELNYLLEDKINLYKPPKNLWFANHVLKTAHFLLRLNSCCKESKTYSFDFFLEHRTKKKNGDWPIIGAGKMFFIPDALLVIGNENKKSLLYLETDIGTEKIAGSLRNKSDISKKLKAYMDYMSSKGYEETSKQLNYQFKGFRTLIITSPLRLKRISELCEKIDTKGIVWLTTFEKLEENLLFNSIWHVPCFNKGLQSLVKK